MAGTLIPQKGPLSGKWGKTDSGLSLEHNVQEDEMTMITPPKSTI